MSTRQDEVLAENEVLFRDLNAAIRGDGGQPVHEFACECSDLRCSGRIVLSLEEYRQVRASDRQFFVLPGHDVEAVEDVVERHDRYWVVRKHPEFDEIVGAER